MYTINSLTCSNSQVASYEKRLSICLTSNGFSFSLCSDNDTLLAVGEAQCNMNAPMSELMGNIKGVFAEAGIQPYGLRQTELVVPSRQFVWIPQHLYDANKERQYIESLCDVEKGYALFSNANDAVGAQIVFTADANIVSAFKIAIPGLLVTCQHCKMANATIMAQSDLKSVLMMNLRHDVTDFAVFCNKKLQLSNSFDCANIEETLYYAMNLTKQFHLEDAKLTCAVCGDVDREKFAFIRRFFPDTVLFTGKPMTLSVPEMQHTPLYRFALTF